MLVQFLAFASAMTAVAAFAVGVAYAYRRAWRRNESRLFRCPASGEAVVADLDKDLRLDRYVRVVSCSRFGSAPPICSQACLIALNDQRARAWIESRKGHVTP